MRSATCSAKVASAKYLWPGQQIWRVCHSHAPDCLHWAMSPTTMWCMNIDCEEAQHGKVLLLVLHNALRNELHRLAFMFSSLAVLRSIWWHPFSGSDSQSHGMSARRKAAAEGDELFKLRDL